MSNYQCSDYGMGRQIRDRLEADDSSVQIFVDINVNVRVVSKVWKDILHKKTHEDKTAKIAQDPTFKHDS